MSLNRVLATVAVIGAASWTGSLGCAPAELDGGPQLGDTKRGGGDSSTAPDGGAPGDRNAGDLTRLGDAASTGDPASSGDSAWGDGAGGDHAPAELSRGMRWVRDNPMFISALTVTMGAPPSDFVDAYYDDFDANATHLWARGLPTAMDGWAAAGRSDFRWVSWVKDDGTSWDGGELIGGYPADSPGRIGYQVGDEPGLNCDGAACSLAELQQAEVGVDAIRAHDPDALIYINFSHYADGIDQLLRYYGEQMDGDIVSFDQYDRSGKRTYENLDMFRRAGLAYGKPYWRYLKAFYKNRSESLLTESDMRWNAFSGLLYGYTGHTWFIYQVPDSFEHGVAFFDQQGTFDAGTTAAFDIAAQLNREMAVWGRSITQLTSTAVAYDAAILNPLGTTPWSAGMGNDPYLTDFSASASGFDIVEALIGLFVDDDGEHYVMVQNVNHSNGPFPVDNANEGTIELAFDFSSAPTGFDTSAVASLNKITGSIDRVPLVGTGDTRTLSVPLAAGDAFFFKYETGAPFALQPEP